MRPLCRLTNTFTSRAMQKALVESEGRQVMLLLWGGSVSKSVHKATNVLVNCQYRALTNSGAEGYSTGRPRKRPKKLHAEKGLDFRRCRAAV